ncbi:MAG: ACT domain-containing protein [Deinococcus sp.]|nr:ACT domain-containing protein [Deinococcus sp.]
MTDLRLTLSALPDTFAICRLHQDVPVPGWALGGDFFSITRTPDELSVVYLQSRVPEQTKCDRGWRCLKVHGPFAFSVVGVVASLTAPLARAGISVFVVSTYDTDYLLVKEADLERAVGVLAQDGHRVQ